MSHKLVYIMQREGLPMDAPMMSAVAAEIEEFWNKRGDTTMTNETIMGDPVMTDTEELKPTDARKVVEDCVDALEAALVREYNPFEPDNQSQTYKKIHAALTAAKAYIGEK